MSTARAGGGTRQGSVKAQDNSGRMKKVKFHVQADPGAAVFVAGSFNNWDPASYKMKQNGDRFYEASVVLPAGKHEYKFLVNGVWQTDPDCPTWVANSFGTLNSVMDVA